MQDKINKIILIVIILLILIFGLIFIIDKNKKKEYTTKFYYMDTYIYVKLYGKDSNKINKALKEVEKIYKEYHEITDRYNSYDNINNIYYIKNNKSDDEYIKIDKRLYDILKYGIDAYKKTDGLVDISMGNVIDIWKKYRDNNNGVPSTKELEKVNNSDINDIILKDGNKIKNNHVNIDLGAISKGYTTKVVGEYLDSIGINEYLINAGGNVLVGKHYEDSNYKIGIEDPNNKNDIFTVLKGNNISVVTSGGYERYYEYEDKKYHHIISPKTLYPTDYMKSVTIITKDSALADMLSTYLFLIDIEDGKEYINNLDNVEAIWYTNDDEIVLSDGAKKYVYK